MNGRAEEGERMVEIARRAGAVAGGLLLGALALGGCAATAPAPPAVVTPPSASPAPATAAPTTTTSAGPPPLPVVAAKDGTNLRACRDGSCEVAVDGTPSFRVGSYTVTVTPGPTDVDVQVAYPSGASGGGSLSSVGPGFAVGSQGRPGLEVGLAGRDPQGRPVVTFAPG